MPSTDYLEVDIFWLLDRQQLRLDQWVTLDILHGQWIECVWVNWELYAELTGELNSEDRSNDEELLYPLLVEVPNIPIVLFGTCFGISGRWVERPRSSSYAASLSVGKELRGNDELCP